jgi:hypothetical protein
MLSALSAWHFCGDAVFFPGHFLQSGLRFHSFEISLARFAILQSQINLHSNISHNYMQIMLQRVLLTLSSDI